MAGTVQARTRTGRSARPDVEVIFFTDPYSTWCWASEPAWLRLRENYGHAVHFRTVMGGLVEMGQVPDRDVLRRHMHDVSARTGQPIDPAILDGVDERFSTWPACIHVKAAQHQGADLGERFLRRARLAVMTEARHASDPAVAERLVADVEGLEPTGWRGALADGSALAAFFSDRSACSEAGITGFPTMVIRSSEPRRRPRRITGFRPFAEIEVTLRGVAPWLRPRPPRPVVDLLFDLGPLTTREIQELEAMTPRETLDTLDGLAETGTVEAVRRAGGTLWRLAE